MNRKITISVLAISLLISGCGDKNNQVQTPPPPIVTTQSAEIISLQRSREYVGRISAPEDVSVSAQVTGYIQTRHFTEGEMVEKGQLLYQIEESAFKALVASAKAEVEQAKANLARAELDFNRGKNLLPQGNISQSEYDALTAAKLSAHAQLEAANAQLYSAEVNLSYTSITAPISGRISESNTSIGDLVSANSGSLTTIVSLDPIHVGFSVSERERMTMGMERISGDGANVADEIEVAIVLENGEQYDQLGEIDYVANRINLDTGTLGMRARIDNPMHQLLPGQHVNVLLKEKRPHHALVIPRTAVQSDLQGNFVMLVTKDNIVQRRNVQMGVQTEHGVVITDGLASGESVVIKGLQRIRHGQEVTTS